MRTEKVVQGSAEWLQCRTGKLTASRVGEATSYNQPSAAQAKAAGFKLVAEAAAAGIKGKESAVRENYRAEIVAERLTKRATEHFITNAMMHGMENESDAIVAYEIARDAMISRLGFALHPVFDWSGASVDGLVGDDGIIEVKCPTTKTHLAWMMDGVVPDEHKAQCYWGMLCCERQWADFVSYDPRLPEDLQLFIARLPRDEAAISELEAEVVKMNNEVDDEIARLRAKAKALNEKAVEAIEWPESDPIIPYVEEDLEETDGN